MSEKNETLTRLIKLLATTPDEKLVAHLTNELNHYVAVVHDRGKRKTLTPGDMRCLLNRMLDVIITVPEPDLSKLAQELEEIKDEVNQAQSKSVVTIKPVTR